MHRHGAMLGLGFFQGDEMLQLSMTGPLTELVSQIEDLRSEGVTQLNAGGPLGADPEQTIRLIGRPPTGPYGRVRARRDRKREGSAPLFELHALEREVSAWSRSSRRSRSRERNTADDVQVQHSHLQHRDEVQPRP